MEEMQLLVNLSVTERIQFKEKLQKTLFLPQVQITFSSLVFGIRKENVVMNQHGKVQNN